MIKRIFLILWMLVLFIFLFNKWIGDPTIYFVYAKNLLAGHGLCFNIGYPSASFSSPLWLLIVAACQCNPIAVKIVSFLIFTVGIILINERKGLVIASIVVYLSFRYCFLCYETPLIILATGLFLAKREWEATLIFTLARPEAILLVLIVAIIHKVKWTAVIPAVNYYILIFIYCGIPASFVARAGGGWWVEMRYALILLPVLIPFIEEMIDAERWREYAFIAVFVMASSLKLVFNSYSFDVVTLRDVASYVKADDILLTPEIQIKYWLPDGAVVRSTDGLLKEEPKPITLFLRTNNDPPAIGLERIVSTQRSDCDALYRMVDK